ncbi:hypothetical protein OPT61_g5259 [Boeremia exigua]|uniref:Uncharacterized protein n=1 Tax=Boeremia exigua TaxID=749465 RepID=A0ACC2IAX1_9PLEO|nr:hypothetical protein OPT61_g5259 [Boeremia exigua]
MADRLKTQVKRNVAHRIRRKKIQSLSRDLNHEFVEMSPPPPPIVPEFGRNTDTPFVSFPTPESPLRCVTTPRDIHTTQSEADSQDALGGHHIDAHSNVEPAAAYEAPDFESSLLMSYLDYAFPILFPFYKPSVLEGGRAWLLTLALKYPAFYHNVIGLAAYFFCAVPVMPGPEHDVCTAKAETELQMHMEKAVQGVQDSLRFVTERGVDHCLSEDVRLLGNIVQLVNFEVVFASSANWQLHLAAAVDLFDETIRHFGQRRREATTLSVLLGNFGLDTPSSCSFWSAEQAALRFFAATLIHQDVIASTAGATTPRLFAHYDGLLAKSSNLDSAPELLNLECFTGCPNWVLRSIAEVSYLNEWKNEAKREGRLDIVDLVQRAAVIQQSLRDGNTRLDNTTANASLQTNNSPCRPLESILAKSNIASYQKSDTRAISKIWAHAVEIYLITVLSGWQPGNVRLRNHVSEALDHLRAIDNPSWLRTLAWPFCIIGCFATEEQEAAFHNVAIASGGLAMFGTMRESLAIMQKVWSLRYQHNADVWDVAYCLRILGHSVLLV